MPERYVVHRKRGQLPPFAFNISFGDEFAPGASRGEWQSRWIPRISDTAPPPQMQTHPFLSPLVPPWTFRNTGPQKGGGGDGGGRPVQGFPICLPQ